MKPELEAYLEKRIRQGFSPRDAINDMLDSALINSPKQAWATLLKWSNKGKYDYGVTLDLGYMVDRLEQ